MTSYKGPELPEEPEDLEPISEEDVLRQVYEALGDDEPLSLEVSRGEAEEIKNFLVNFNIKDADAADIEDVDMIWRRLKGSPSLVKDFTYTLLTLKEALNHSTHPIALSFEELLQYASGLKNPDDVRPWLIAHTASAVGRMGLDTYYYSDRALSESKNPKIRPDSTRFLGWVLSQGFLADLPTKKDDFIKKHRLERFTIRDLASLATINVGEELGRLDRQSLAYRSDRSMETDALEKSHQEIVIAVRGIYRMCGIMFLSKAGEV